MPATGVAVAGGWTALLDWCVAVCLLAVGALLPIFHTSHVTPPSPCLCCRACCCTQVSDVNDKKVLCWSALHRDPAGGPACCVFEGVTNMRDQGALMEVSACKCPMSQAAALHLAGAGD